MRLPQICRGEKRHLTAWVKFIYLLSFQSLCKFCFLFLVHKLDTFFYGTQIHYPSIPRHKNLSSYSWNFFLPTMVFFPFLFDFLSFILNVTKNILATQILFNVFRIYIPGNFQLCISLSVLNFWCGSQRKHCPRKLPKNFFSYNRISSLKFWHFLKTF